MKTIGEILDAKGRQVWTAGPEESVLAAVRRMTEKGVGALLVLEGGRVAGILSERDCARKAIPSARPPDQIPVRDVMTPRVVCAGPDQTVEECMALVTDKRVRHLPVVEGDRLVGMVSIGDLVKALIEEQKFVIEQLEHYITGRVHPG